MLPIYEAIDIVKKIPKNVGHTEPWVILANTPNGLGSFVAKLYTTAEVENNNSVTNEVICNSLATQLDLKVPKCALIDIPDTLIFSKAPEYQFQYSLADPRFKFATELVSDYNSAVPSLTKRYYSKRISMETLFAFDNMIRNGDRGQQKTNLLLTAKDALLIDHEYSLNSAHITGIDWDNFEIEGKFTQHQLFYSYLKAAWKSKKQHYFDEFQEHLRLLNINLLTPYFNQLANEGFNTQATSINTWLTQLKQNSTTFINTLKGSLE